MDHNISFCFHVHRIEIVFALFLFLVHGVLCLNSNSTNCEPQNCGNGPKIEHPFWIEGVQEPSCGSSGFGVSCKDRNPVLRISGDDYGIINIFYANESLLLSQYQSYDGSNLCPVPKQNFSVEGAFPFSYGPETMDLFFFYNCSLPYEKETYVVDCASNSSRHSFAVFHLEILEHGNYSISSCQAMINAPVTADAMETLLNENFSQVLKRGFVLQWGNCRNCRGSQAKKSPNIPVKIAIGLGTSFGTALIAALLFIVYKRRQTQRTNSSSTLLSGDIYSSYSSFALDPEKCISNFGVHIFDYYELEEATNNFDPERELGDGGFGTVYKGKLKDGRDVAVKRLYENNFKRVDHFKNEVIILTRLRHKNLVTLYGCTSRHSRELLLVYEYVANGTVADHLHGALAKPGSLPWSTRMKIAVETASALCYLHASDVIHRDVKTNNILLDSNFCVKVADFGLSRLFPLHMTHISTAPQGTPGYVDPEYHQCYQLTDRSDVFSFGVVLIELITSMPAVDITRHRHEINLSNLAINKIQSKTLHEIVDPNLGFERDETVRLMVLDVAELAFQSLQQGRDMRPSMQEVLDALKHIQAKDENSRNVSESDNQADEAKLLEARNVTFSPNSVIEGWTSSSTTPNISN